MRIHFTLFRFIFFAFCFNLFIGNSFVYAQEKENLPYSISFFSAKEGLPQAQVIDIIETKRGIIISTTNGISLFNGKNFERLINDNISTKVIYNKLFYSDHTDILYGFSQDGFYDQLYPTYKKLGNYFDVVKRGDTTVGLTATKKIESFIDEPSQLISSVTTDISMLGNIIRGEQYFYIQTKNTIYFINNSGSIFHTINAEDVDLVFSDPYKHHVYMIKRNGELYTLSEDASYLLTLPLPQNEYIRFRSTKFLSPTEYYIVTNIGLFYIKNNHVSYYPILTEGAALSIFSINYIEKEKLLLLGTENKGLGVLFPTYFKIFYIPIFAGTQSFTSAIKDKDDFIYSTAGNGVILKIKNSEIQDVFNVKKDISTMSLINDTLYYGVWDEGIWKLEGKNSRQITSLPEFKDRTWYRAIYQDKSGNIWVGGNNGISILDLKKKTLKRVASESINESIYTIGELRNGTLFIGGDDSFFIINKKGELLEYFSKKDGFNSRQVRCFYEDEEQRVWIGAYGGGLYVLENSKLTSINEKQNSLLNNDVFTIAKHKNLLFLSSNQGLYYIAEKDLIDFYLNKKEYLIPGFLGNESGLKNVEFNGGFNNSYTIVNDNLYFPTIDGFVELPFGYINQERSVSPPVKIKSFLVNDTVYPLSTSKRLKRSTNTISIVYQSTNFTEEKNIYYQYRLLTDNNPSPWGSLKKNESTTFNRLPPGNYEFQVRAVDKNNDPDPIITQIAFTIEPYFYETLSFKLFTFLALVLALYFFIRKQFRRERRKNQMKNKLLELELEVVHSKLNPHFIFNTLNNIAFLLDDKQYEKTEHLLQDFLRLLRSYLERDNDTFISIKKELEILRLYLNIQEQRYNYQFTYSISCSEDLYSIDIPSMLIQPLIENSINHGLAHKEGKGFVNLSIASKDGFLTIQIEDNGVGREEANLINNNRKSSGNTLINEKIRLLKSKYNMTVTMEIIDIVNGDERGTIVVLKIPMEDLRVNSHE